MFTGKEIYLRYKKKRYNLKVNIIKIEREKNYETNRYIVLFIKFEKSTKSSWKYTHTHTHIHIYSILYILYILNILQYGYFYMRIYTVYNSV